MGWWPRGGGGGGGRCVGDRGGDLVASAVVPTDVTRWWWRRQLVRLRPKLRAGGERGGARRGDEVVAAAAALVLRRVGVLEIKENQTTKEKIIVVLLFTPENGMYFIGDQAKTSDQNNRYIMLYSQQTKTPTAAPLLVACSTGTGCLEKKKSAVARTWSRSEDECSGPGQGARREVSPVLHWSGKCGGRKAAAHRCSARFAAPPSRSHTRRRLQRAIGAPRFAERLWRRGFVSGGCNFSRYSFQS
uniref:Uncharacterized protein n=1 Tax=Oryza glumipatula TaxID=40148 RepID=A0A0E0ADC2_9ORYZ